MSEQTPGADDARPDGDDGRSEARAEGDEARTDRSGRRRLLAGGGVAAAAAWTVPQLRTASAAAAASPPPTPAVLQAFATNANVIGPGVIAFPELVTNDGGFVVSPDNTLFTVPQSGTYRVTYGAILNSTFLEGQAVDMVLTINGSDHADQLPVRGGSAVSFKGSCDVVDLVLAIGDAVGMRSLVAVPNLLGEFSEASVRAFLFITRV